MRTVLITGANRGIGFEFCRQFKERGDTVIALCRKSTPELNSLGIQIFENIDVRNFESLQQCAASLSGVAIDILINNAGYLHRESLDNLDYEMMLRQYEINTLGPLKVTEAFLSHLSSGSKIIFLSSVMASIAENESSGYYGYRMSKTALNMAGRNLSLDLKAKGITVLLLHPGYVQTDMTGHKGDITPDKAAANMIELLEEKGLESTGTYWHSANKKMIEW
jgi:NAD(P)-dependent dehydrogenase (short-subunit alcohol dehydrogenase family)